jgi:hypothetical protein
MPIYVFKIKQNLFRPKVNYTSELIRMVDEGKAFDRKIAVLIEVDRPQIINTFMRIGMPDILKEHLLTLSTGFRMPRNHFMYHLTDDVVQNLLAAGILNFFKQFHVYACIKYYKEPEWEPKVFALDDLLFGFYIWLAACAVSLTVMALEWTWFHGKRTTIRIIKNTIGLWIIIAKLRRGFM